MNKRIEKLKKGTFRLLVVMSFVYTSIFFSLIDGFQNLDKPLAYPYLIGIWLSFWVASRITLWVIDGYNSSI